MKKIMLMALAGFTFFSAGAQKQSSEVCKISKSKKSCYHTKYSENFKVCKNDYMYYICGEAISYRNSTKPDMSVRATQPQMAYTQNMDQQQEPATDPNAMLAPQSQSYPSTFAVNSEVGYAGYYPQKHYITVSYTENVAEENRAPYEGLPSPAYDGPAKNAERNLNEANPNANLAPITGRRE